MFYLRSYHDITHRFIVDCQLNLIVCFYRSLIFLLTLSSFYIVFCLRSFYRTLQTPMLYHIFLRYINNRPTAIFFLISSTFFIICTYAPCIVVGLSVACRLSDVI